MNWDLSALFESDAAAKGSAQKLEKKCKKFNERYKDALKNLEPKEFKTALKKYESLSEAIARIITYAYLQFATDSAKGGYFAEYQKICTKLHESLLFF